MTILYAFVYYIKLETTMYWQMIGNIGTLTISPNVAMINRQISSCSTEMKSNFVKS